ncbi:MAG: MFS transporter [Caulobacteraceae bacterium]|nr:MFS transporter [Caulobacteraceae bacterium]
MVNSADGVAPEPRAKPSPRTGESDKSAARPVGAWWVVALLSLLYVCSSLDRAILALLIRPVRAAFGVSDVQVGLLFGPAFAVLYAFIGLPMARIADRGNRRWLIIVAVCLWASCTLGSALAPTFAILVLLRVGLAAGEAALSPSAYSMIGDLFAPRQRALAASLYGGVGVAGASGAYLLGAAVIAALAAPQAHGVLGPAPWRVVFLAAGLPTLVLCALFAITAKEPARSTGAADVASLRDVLTLIKASPRAYVGLFLGAALTQVIVFSYAAWGPEALRRDYGWSIGRAGLAFGIACLFAGGAGTLIAPQFSHALERAGRRDGVVVASIVMLLLGAACAILAPLQATPVAFVILYGFGFLFLIGSCNNVIVAQQTSAPPRMRGTMVAIILMCSTLLGQSIGPTLTPLLATHLSLVGGRLGGALALTAALALGPSLALLLWCRAPYARLSSNGWRSPSAPAWPAA